MTYKTLGGITNEKNIILNYILFKTKTEYYLLIFKLALYLYHQPIEGRVLYRRRERLGSMNFWQPAHQSKVPIPAHVEL